MKPFGFLKKENLQKHVGAILIISIIFPLCIAYGRFIYAPSDDAYIFCVYARNFIDGNGLTYNGARVEGFSSVLWILLLSILGLTRIPLPVIAESLSLVTGLFALLATYFLGSRFSLGKRWALLPPLLLASTGDFAFYMSVGLEHVLFTALVAIGVSFYLSAEPEPLLRSCRFPLLMAAMILARPEGALISAVLLLLLGLSCRSFRLPIRCAAVLFLILVPVMVSKWMYYGYWLPNTYYVKGNAGISNLHQGIRYLDGSMPRYGGVLACAVLLCPFAMYKVFFVKSRSFTSLLFIVAIWFFYVTIQGGDNMVGGRVILPMLPLCYVLLGRLAKSIPPALAIIGTVLVITSLVLGYAMDKSVAESAEACRWCFAITRSAGLYLRKNFPADTLVALNPAGVAPYYSELPTIDMLGLNDIHIAHEGKRDRTLCYAHQAGDGDYVLKRKPGVILFDGHFPKEASSFVSDREIWADKEFHENYELAEWPGIGFAYIRKR